MTRDRGSLKLILAQCITLIFTAMLWSFHKRLKHEWEQLATVLKILCGVYVVLDQRKYVYVCGVKLSYIHILKDL